MQPQPEGAEERPDLLQRVLKSRIAKIGAKALAAVGAFLVVEGNDGKAEAAPPVEIVPQISGRLNTISLGQPQLNKIDDNTFEFTFGSFPAHSGNNNIYSSRFRIAAGPNANTIALEQLSPLEPDPRASDPIMNEDSLSVTYRPDGRERDALLSADSELMQRDAAGQWTRVRWPDRPMPPMNQIVDFGNVHATDTPGVYRITAQMPAMGNVMPWIANFNTLPTDARQGLNDAITAAGDEDGIYRNGLLVDWMATIRQDIAVAGTGRVLGATRSPNMQYWGMPGTVYQSYLMHDRGPRTAVDPNDPRYVDYLYNNANGTYRVPNPLRLADPLERVDYENSPGLPPDSTSSGIRAAVDLKIPGTNRNVHVFITVINGFPYFHAVEETGADTLADRQIAMQPFVAGVTPPSDIDGDTIPDAVDNCEGSFNPDQVDLDNDGIGEACAVNFWRGATMTPSGLVRAATPLTGYAASVADEVNQRTMVHTDANDVVLDRMAPGGPTVVGEAGRRYRYIHSPTMPGANPAFNTLRAPAHTPMEIQVNEGAVIFTRDGQSERITATGTTVMRAGGNDVDLVFEGTDVGITFHMPMPPMDAGVSPEDSGNTAMDGEIPDARMPEEDAGQPIDAGMIPPDAGVREDAMPIPIDAGHTGGPDAMQMPSIDVGHPKSAPDAGVTVMPEPANPEQPEGCSCESIQGDTKLNLAPILLAGGIVLAFRRRREEEEPESKSDKAA
ncbi:hypothetical protein COV82_02530 [Candidatus Peregrinibacteria bacterium CG11_big_fil_rev_8_21_14_0_20_46_8]|nr:MAG: hypothetical protein COV82_02530 [Candidatus Peregrinibacteria bacterium CG11_big_fil_rev_8_21_14_0_20_46_8]